jgi:hypothetical protein
MLQNAHDANPKSLNLSKKTNIVNTFPNVKKAFQLLKRLRVEPCNRRTHVI